MYQWPPEPELEGERRVQSSTILGNHQKKVTFRENWKSAFSSGTFLPSWNKFLVSAYGFVLLS